MNRFQWCLVGCLALTIACSGPIPPGPDDPVPPPPPPILGCTNPLAESANVALYEGDLCEKTADGNYVSGRCAEGLSCGKVASGNCRCSQDCTSDPNAEVCGEGKKCRARPSGTTASGYCSRLAAVGETCDEARLQFCSHDGPVVCVTKANSTEGKCFAECIDKEDCLPDQSCVAWSSKVGVCVAPQSGGQCNYSELVLCEHGKVCQSDSASNNWGTCVTPLPRCEAGTDTSQCKDCRCGVCDHGDACVQEKDVLPEQWFCRKEESP
jgi:hypothetical protein